MYSEVAWVLVSSVTKVQAQVILDPDYFPDYPSFSYDCDLSKVARKKIVSSWYIQGDVKNFPILEPSPFEKG